MGKYSRLGKNTVLVFIGNVGSKVIGLLMLPFYTGWLSVEDYGLTDVINIYVSFLLSIVSCCIAESIFIFPKGQAVGTQKQYFSSGVAFVVMALSVSGLVAGAVDAAASLGAFSNSFTDNIWLIYGLMAAMLFQQLFQQFTRSIDKMAVYGMAGIILTAFTALLSYVLIPLWGVTGYVLSLIMAHLLTALYSLLFSGGYKYWSFASVSREKCKEMLAYSVPLIPNGIMWWLVNALNRPVMETYAGMHAIGLFAVANKFPGIIAMVFNIFVTSWQISVLEEYGKEGYSEFFNKVFRSVVLMLLVMLVVIAFSGKWLVEMLTSPAYIEAWRYIPLLTFGTVFSCISGLAGTNFAAVRKSKYFFCSSMYGGIASVIFNFVLIPLWGIWGASVSVVLSFMVMAVSRIAYGWKYVRLTHLSRLILMLLLSIGYVLAVCLWENVNRVMTGIVVIAMLFLLNTDLVRSLNKIQFKNILRCKN